METRIVRLEEHFWHIRSPEGALAAEEQQELKAYLDEVRLPYQLIDGAPGIPGAVSWEVVYEVLGHYYDGRADVLPF
ncbi:MAG: hypothetical protein KDN22_20950 [Verrucomicrobiae bacterium]|nr:hypothetical protein [Verrucomicrobiae bacterium]